MKIQKILIIEDDKDNMLLTELALKMKADWKIITAFDGIEGITKAETEKPDIILLDVILPDIDGLLVYDILINNFVTNNIPIIFTTAMVNLRLLKILKIVGAAGIITKPFNTIDLVSNIEKIYNRWYFNQIWSLSYYLNIRRRKNQFLLYPALRFPSTLFLSQEKLGFI